MTPFLDMTDDERVALIDGLVDELTPVMNNRPVVAIAAAVGTIIGQALDKTDTEIFLVTLATNAQLAACSSCGCPDCIEKRDRLMNVRASEFAPTTLQ